MDAWFSAGLGWTWLLAGALLLVLAALGGLQWWRSLEESRPPHALPGGETELGAGDIPLAEDDAAAPEDGARATEDGAAATDDVAAASVDGPGATEGGTAAAEGGTAAAEGGTAAAEGGAAASEHRAPDGDGVEEEGGAVSEGPAPPETTTKGLLAGSPLAPRPTQHPLVLVHGVLGFDRMQVAGIRFDYFRGVIDALRRHGFEVHVVRVNPLAPIPVRAAQLAEQVLALGVGRVNLVAHSMGGLDARYALAHLGLGDRVASLTTIGTPHRGTPVADHGTRWLGDFLGLRWMAARFGADVDGFWQLTTHHMERFNAEVPDVGGVWYASVVSEGRSANPILRVTRSLLERGHGASDGLVPTDSQRWGTVVDCVDADHWAQIGWGMGFDAPELYVRLGRVLGKRGL